MRDERACNLPDDGATRALGAALAAAVDPPCVIHLAGELGAGKTTLARGFLRGLGHEGRVKSPTFSLLESYRAPGGLVYHLDLYRLAEPGEAAWLGLEELEDEPATILVEWPERGGDWLPPADVRVCLEHAGDGRRARLSGVTARGRALLDRPSLDAITTY